jgi:nucleoside-diphosphate-sugar epimerase
MDEVATVPRPNNRYGLTKLLGEQLVDYEVAQHGLRAVTLRPFMIYDENEDFGDHRSAMIRFAHDLARGRPIQVHRGSAGAGCTSPTPCGPSRPRPASRSTR